jgi:hypothetical protein
MTNRLILLSIATGLLLVATPAAAEVATYRLTVDNTWSETTHPGSFPPDAHFSWLGGGTHTTAVEFWNEGVLATPGIQQMAETGVTDLLVSAKSAVRSPPAQRAPC